MFLHQAECSQQLLVAFRESFAYFQKEFDNSRITLQVMNTSKLVNKKLQLFLCLRVNKI